MKKVLLTTAIAGALASSVFAQGSIQLQASSSHGLVTYSTDGTTKTAVPTGTTAAVSTYGQLNIAAYSAAAGTASPFTATTASLIPAAWNESLNVLHQISPIAGNTPSTTFTLGANSGAGGSSLQIMIVAWTGTYADFNSALQSGQALLGWTGSTLSGGSLSWTQATGAPNAAPPTAAVAVPYGAAGFAGLSLAPVPEPTTMALAGLGAAAMMIFRRRK